MRSTEALLGRVLDMVLQREPRLRTLVLHHAQCEAGYASKDGIDRPGRVSAIMQSVQVR